MSNDLLRQYTTIIESTDTDKESCFVNYKRYSTTGGYWIEEKKIIHRHHIEETLRYLKNWYMDIEEIIFFPKDSNKPSAIYTAVTEVKVISTTNTRN
jgi:hypothetical protein